MQQSALFALLSSPDVRPEDWLRRQPDLARRVVVARELKWEIRDRLDQFNINERTLFPDLSGLSQWLRRYYRQRREPRTRTPPKPARLKTSAIRPAETDAGSSVPAPARRFGASRPLRHRCSFSATPLCEPLRAGSSVREERMNRNPYETALREPGARGERTRTAPPQNAPGDR
ncbi:hypothetical protein [Deinococcus multiflagellatus]|uniref:Transposase n=1 Tax=Deinococcus multiflagellatus TaxID=1656887 RepID=A0ABW1ZGY8_9DEIO